MAIKFCALSSGSSGNCLFLSTENTSILIDAGLSGRRIEQLLNQIGETPQGVAAILVTHEHIDHVRGVGILSRRFNIPIFANPCTWEGMADCIGEISTKHIRTFNTGDEFNIDDLCIRPYPVSHDAADPVGFTFYKDRVKLTVANDLGYVTPAVEREIQGSDFVMLEANHDTEMLKVGPYPWQLKRRIAGRKGHLSNEDAGEALLKFADRGLNTVLLGHLSKNNNYPPLALETVKGILMQQGAEVIRDINIDLALRDRISKVYNITKEGVF